MCANLAATSLIGKEAPERGRGAVLGMWSFCGALGILIVAQVGGYLFDNVTKVGPFLFVASANIALLFWALILMASLVLPASIFPGQRTMKGTRWPPS